jgi:DNA primase small subunit
LNDQSLNYLKQAFSSYYTSLKLIWVPSEIGKREFGFFLWGDRVMTRHRSFKSREALSTFLARQAPFDAYYSVATYDLPEEAMSEKGWRNADVVFDIDADHLEHECSKEHDIWTCRACRREGKGPKPVACPSCNGKEIDNVTWICDRCLGSAKQEVYKLTEVLQEDFGIAEEKVDVYFSGHRGYHVQVKDSLSSIDQAARKELVDYLTGTGILFELHGLAYGAKPSSPLSSGWGMRMLRSIYELVNGESLGTARGDEAVIAKKRRRALEELIRGDLVALSKLIGRRNFEELLASATNRTAVMVDPVVTTDTHRLFRLPETLNSKTGFSKKGVPFEVLGSFDPLADAVALKGKPRKVHIGSAPRFRLLDGWYGPYSDEVATLPQEVVVLLICKGVGEVSD